MKRIYTVLWLLALVSQLKPALADPNDDAAFLMITQPAASSLPAATLALYKFAEGTGTTIADSSGNGHTGTFVNGPIWPSTGGTGFHGYGCVIFATNGSPTNAYIDCGNFADNLPNFTVNTCFKSTGLMVSTFDIMLVSKVGPGSIQDGVGWDTGGEFQQLVAQMCNASVIFCGPAVSASAYNDNNWHTMTATFVNTGTAACVFYLDGSSVGTNQGTKTSTGDISTTAHVCIGGDQSGVADESYFPGAIGISAIVSRIETAGEIASFNSGTLFPP